MADTVIRNNILCGYGQLIYISLYEPVGYFENVDIYGNVFYSTTEYAYGPGSNPANPSTWWTAPSVFIFSNPDLPGRYVNNINIHSNTFLWTGLPGILVIRHSGDHPITNITVLNNVFFDSDVSTSGVDPAEVSSNYNLFFDSPEFGTATPWINEGPSSIIQQDPQFVNYERFVSWDFRLKPTSPAIDAGAPDLAALFNLPTPFLDLDGNTRPFDVPGVGRDGSGAFDIGAHEYGSVPPGGGYILSININGNGSVTRQPDESTYSSGTVVTLVGAPDSGNTFDSWGGALSGSDNPTTITMDSYKTVTANFQEIDVTPPSIVSVSTSQDSVEILFDESLDPCSAVDTSNYTIVDDGNNSIAISSALLHSGDTRVTLSTAAHTENTTYTLAVTDVNDPAGNSMSRTTEQYQYTPINIDANLVGYWKFDDGGGSTAADASVNGNTGTLINGPVWETNTSRIGGAVRLDGGDDAVEIGTANLSVNSGTITLWAYAESFSNTHHFLFGLANQPFSNRVQLYTDDAEGYLDLGLGDSHARHTNIENLDTQTWYHIALTWDGSNYLVYVNAVPKANGTYTGLSTLETYADIGNNGYSAGRNEAFGGNIDEVRIYNRALSADEILVLFNEAPVLMFSPIGDKVVDEGPTLMFDINTVDSNVVVDINDHNLPSEPNFFLNGGDWTFSWTPTYDDAGIYNVTFIATNGEIEDLETIVITVNNVNRAPILATIGSRTVSENEALNFTVSAIDPDGDSVTYSAQNLPAGATLSGDTFDWTPTSAGTYNVTFIASDGQLDDSETITITVTSSGPGSITDGLVGYWKLNDYAANTTVADSSGYGNDGTARQNTSTLSTTGKINGALNFNGISDYINCGNGPTLDITDAITISSWVKFDTLQRNYQTIVAKRGAVEDARANYAFRTGAVTNRDEVEFYYYDGASWHVYTTSNANLAAGTWHHIVVTVTFGTTTGIRCYLNNNLLNGGWTFGNGNSAVQTNTKPVTVGGLATGEKADGAIDNVMVFNRILPEAEIDTLYNGGAGTEIF
jgi:hypothetical protein